MVAPRYLVDTNIWSAAARRQPDRGIERRLRIHWSEVTLAAPTLQELLYGVYRLPPSVRRREIESYVNQIRSTIPVLPYDSVAAEWHAAERARLVSAGLTPPATDSQIAAVAATNLLILVTRNARDYQHFSDLQVEDWSS
jgi:tRNA(fMet)-specific endonuclease VapC